jgi:hypothetical protein
MVQIREILAGSDPKTKRRTLPSGLGSDLLPYIPLRHQMVFSSLRNLVFSPRDR